MEAKLQWSDFIDCCNKIESLFDVYGCTIEIESGEVKVTTCVACKSEDELSLYQDESMEIIVYQCPIEDIEEMVEHMEKEAKEREY